MKKIKTFIYFLLLLGVMAVFAGCSGSKGLSKKGGCGCNMNKGFIGY